MNEKEGMKVERRQKSDGKKVKEVKEEKDRRNEGKN